MKITECPVCKRVKGIDDFLCPTCSAQASEGMVKLMAAYRAAADVGDEHARMKYIGVREKIVQELKDRRMAGKPVGYELVIICGCMPCRREKHWRGTEAACRRKARMESHFISVESVRPFTSEEWNRAFGMPGLRL